MLDELNYFTTEHEIIDYAEYFGEMDLPEDEINERIDLANKMETQFAFILALILADSGNAELQIEAYYTDLLLPRYRNVIDTFYDIDEASDEDTYLGWYTRNSVEKIVNTTILRVADAYYTSEGRAINISADEANAVANYERDIAALKAGYTYKTWVTKNDKKVRRTHREANNQTVKILQSFKVGDVKMMFPMDRSLSGDLADKECINCRCVCRYS